MNGALLKCTSGSIPSSSSCFMISSCIMLKQLWLIYHGTGVCFILYMIVVCSILLSSAEQVM